MSEFPGIQAVVFDFDGVLVESTDIKARAFRELFVSEGPVAVSRILAYHQANGGISRYEKFRYAYREILRRDLSASQEEELGRRFSLLVEEAVAKAPLIVGAKEFLERYWKSVPLYVASGTPEPELNRIVGSRGISRYFRAVYGSPMDKHEILSRIRDSETYVIEKVIMVGDSRNDLNAAERVGARFIGIVAQDAANSFPSEIKTLPDLNSLAEALKSF